MQEIILLKLGEIALKGLNRSTFESVLVKNIKRRIEPLGKFKIQKAQSVIYVQPLDDDIDLNETENRLSRVFGIVSLSRAKCVAKDINIIMDQAVDYLSGTLQHARTFKVEAKRSDKSFPLKSPEICRMVGERLFESFPGLDVDVHHPEITVTIEIRDFAAYIRGGVIAGAGGIPVGTSGRAALLISGGIDSPVAGTMMAKRGLELTAIHFASPPYTSERAHIKVQDLLAQMSEYCGRIQFITVHFTKIQEEIRAKCPEEYFTIIMRRFMMRIASRLAKDCGAGALITGESMGQVASQTLHSIACTDLVTTMPVFRPLIGMDKEEIVTIARKIDTFDISIQPYEDCCTVFTPKHPRTRPLPGDLDRAEAGLSTEPLVEEAVAGVSHTVIHVKP